MSPNVGVHVSGEDQMENKWTAWPAVSPSYTYRSYEMKTLTLDYPIGDSSRDCVLAFTLKNKRCGRKEATEAGRKDSEGRNEGETKEGIRT